MAQYTGVNSTVHYKDDRLFQKGVIVGTHDEPAFSYTFENFFHPYVGELIEQLNTKSLAGLLDPTFHASLTREFFSSFYTALTSNLVAIDASPKEIDVRDGGPYSNYNWELLFHVPLTIAVHLSKNQRFSEAQRWFHYIFDPTCNDVAVDPPARFWKFLRFRQHANVQQIDEALAILSKPADECTAAELTLKQQILAGYAAIRNRPFQPHAVARTRTIAYQYSVVMKYLDNLIAWGDHLFTQDTIESINEATQHYVLAANLLGPRPQQIPPQGIVRPKTFAQLKAAGLDAMGNALVELEGQFPFNFGLPLAAEDGAEQNAPLFGIGHTLYFCIPRNDKLLAYWDIVGDRLFKIRHCMNIEGVVRMLALFDPPLDPGMLVKAAAAGIGVGSIVSGLNQPIGPLRCLPLIRQALELTSEVRALGTALLTALEKRDGERLGLLRQAHEIKIQQMTREVRFIQWKQAQEATEVLLRTRASALERYRFYQRLLGLTPDSTAAPEALGLTRRELTEDNFDETYQALVEQYDKAVQTPAYPTLKLAGDSPARQSGATGQGKLYLSSNEDSELNVHGPEARHVREDASAADRISGILALIPDMGIDLHFWGLGGHANLFGGSLLAGAGRFYGSVKNTEAANKDAQGGNAAKTAGYERRSDDWLLQSNLAARELMQLGRQIISSLIAEQAAQHEYLNVQAQITNANEVDQLLHDKFTSEELYGWMQGEISRLYYQYYRFAFDTAKKAERAMKQDLMRPEADATEYVHFNYWDGGRKGLLAGEALHLDTKRMELAYHDQNKRELELTRHVSLRQLDPVALLTLKATGRCEVAIPESFYDRECPGHYMRRLKAVGVSIPSVVGPYTSVNCTLTLLRSSIRRSPLLKDGAYGRTGGDDGRFVDYFGQTESIVTSGATNDAGMFETNLHDDRVLPFENAGAVSTWRVDLPKQLRTFDYSSIADVLLHVRYTARNGGDLLAGQAGSELDTLLEENSRLSLLLSVRHDFPTEWSAFVNGNADFTAPLFKSYFPYFVQGVAIAIDSLELYATAGSTLKKRTIAVPGTMSDDLNAAAARSNFTIAVDNEVMKRDAATQAFLVVRYSVP